MSSHQRSGPIDACAHHLDLACSLLDDSVNQLGAATNDMARLQRVTSLKRCYQLATEGEVRNAQYQLVSEIEPPIRELITRAEAGMSKLKRRQRMLAAKAAPKPSEALQRRLNELQERREALSRSNAELELRVEAAERARPAR